MPSLKSEMANNDKGWQPPRKKFKPVKIESTMENITLPTDDWFEEMEDGNVRLSWSTLGNHLSKITRGIYEVIEISDGEELDKVFPIRSNSKEAGKSQKENDTGTMQLFNDNYDDDNDESDLEIILVKKTPAKQKPEVLVNVSQYHERCETTVVNNSTSTTVQDAPVHSDEHIIIPNWENIYGITQLHDKKVATWINKYREHFSEEFNYFDQSIWKHITENLQNDHTFWWKMEVKQMLHTIIQKSLPTQNRSNLIAVGSTVNGCGSFDSDMDLCLCLNYPSQPMQEEYDLTKSFAVKHLKKIQKILRKERYIIQSVRCIPAKVPILNIHFQPPYHTLEVDMNINNFTGIYNSYLIHHYTRIDVRFSPLCLLVKHWAKEKGILNACNGYFNSYSLILMVLHFLQCGLEIPVLPNMQFLYPDFFTNKELLQEMKLLDQLPRPLPKVPPNIQSIGELLINFFVYYHKFNFKRDAISIRLGRTFPRYELARNTERFKIYIEEPFECQNTARCITNKKTGK